MKLYCLLVSRIMDYQFRHDIYGLPIAKFSMGHEAIGQWFSDELGKSKIKTNELINIVNQIECGDAGFKEIKGSQLLLTINLMSVEVEALENNFSDDDFPKDEYSQDNDGNEKLHDCELKAECGLQDFKLAVVDWLDFIS